MWPSLSEIIRGLYAVLRIARLDREAVRHIDASPPAALRSFAVLLVLIPIWVLQVVWSGVVLEGDQTPFNFPTLVALVIVSRILSILFFYTVAERMTRQMGLRAHFLLYVTAQNWSAVPATLVVVAFTGLWTLLAPAPENIIWLVAGLQSMAILYSWLVTVATLPVGALTGFAFCMLEIISALIVQRVMELIIRLTSNALGGG